MNLAGMTFRAISNSKNGSLNTETEMRFDSDDGIVVGSYRGGTISTGHVLAKHIGDGQLQMLYQGATTDGTIQAGHAHATFAPNDDNKMQMNLDWRWLTGDQSEGSSAWVLVTDMDP